MAIINATDPEAQVFVDQSLSKTGAGQAATRNQVQAKAPNAPPKADAIKNKTLVSGLVDALNKYQAEISGPEKEKPQLYPDRYNIVLVDEVLQNAKVVPPGQTNLKQAPMTQAQTANQQKNPTTQKVNNNAKTTKILAGTSIVQFLDQLVRSSTYIYDQQTAVYDPKTGKLVENTSTAATTGWYRIGLEATPQPGKFDTKRNDWAYDITYSVNIYAVSDVKSDFFPPPLFRGTQKKYYYWFTGENTQVLDFSQDYNYLYYIVSNGPNNPRTNTSSHREIEKRYYQVNSPESSQGQDDDKVNEPAANAADYLYSPGDQGRVSLKIVGDPAWIFQGETWSGIQGLNFNYGPFLSDGTINYEGQEVLFELAWNNPVDYDLQTGIADPTTKNYNRSATSAGQPKQSFVYQATECVSHFRGGRFEQDLTGVLKIYPIPGTEPVSRPNQTASTTGLAAANKSPAARISAKTAAKAAKFQDNNVGSSELDFGDDLGVGNPVQPPKPNILDDYTDPEAALIDGANDVPLRPAPASRPATSGGQIVDPEAAFLQGAQLDTQSGTQTAAQANEQALAIARSTGQIATGQNVGRQVDLLLTLPGQAPIVITSQTQLDALRQSGQIDNTIYREASIGLAQKQQAANAPVTSRPGQLMRRET